MRITSFLGLSTAIILAFSACKSQKGKIEFVHPEAGKRVSYGQEVKLTLKFPDATIDSVVYSVDGKALETKNDTSSVILNSQNFALGDRSLTAKVYASGKEEIAYSNIFILPPNAKNYGFEVVNTFPHDPKAFTQGLQFENGSLYETTGQYGGSQLRKVELATGKVVKSTNLEEKFFGEGMTIVGDKIFFLTWMEGVGFVYNKNTFEREATFNYNVSKEGWGLTYDGNRLIKSDGTNKLYFLNPTTGEEQGSVAVFDENGAVDSLNELEYIEGKVYANVYQKEIIVIIDPETGIVEGRINLVGMYTEGRQAYDNELNGIAYDPSGKRIFVTGKLWPQIYEIKLIER